jgi:hypothetical protein
MAGQSRPERKEWMQRASVEAFLHDPRIIRKQGEKKMNNRIMGVHKEVTEMEEEEENLTCAWKHRLRHGESVPARPQQL